MMIEILSHWDKGNILNLVPEGSITESNIHSSIVVFVELFLLQKLIFSLKFLKLVPLFFETFERYLSPTLDSFV